MTEPAMSEPMSAVDRAWLDMDDPCNPMVISAIFQLEGPVDAANLQKVMVERLLRYPRFHQRVDRSQGAPRWVTDKNLDFRHHVHVRRLPHGANQRELRKAISAEVSRELDHNRPLWRLLLYPCPSGPVTVLFRAHHALADGIALVTLLIDSTDRGFQRAPEPQTAAVPMIRPGPLGGLIDTLELLNHGLIKLGSLARSRAGRSRLLTQFHEGRDAVAAVRRVLTLPENNPPFLHKPLSGHRGVAWADEIPLEPIRRQAKALGVRVNDLLMTALAGAFNRQLQHTSAELAEEQNLRISVPVNLRSGKGRSLGNHFGLVLLDLPVGVRSPRTRLHLVAQRMTALKESPQARATMLGLAAAGHLPVPLERKLVDRIGAKSVAVVSSLPGPRRHVHIGGARMRNLVFWPPQSGGIGIGLSFFSYAGQLSFGVSTDLARLPNPRGLLEAFRSELEELQRLTPEPEPTTSEPLPDVMG
ncbi:wax ester/triacylglycerol synthase family O-acyltransferase [Nevskia soli]|uniref:wax ester/triacylglycerol synthase family O-acyltransferase n=1 Tax=Nevskia soli TaxID=418856 RepID=UPI0004A76817|nr:wax ester/triacylglycerol synthase family O-acyltransferase [Nevskia soli]